MNSLICQNCRSSYSLDDPLWRCSCGGLLDISFSVSFPIDKIRARTPNMWRYREALPISHDSNIVSFGEGFTPLIDYTVDGRTVKIKQDYLFPSGSFKDRGSSVLLSKIKELDVKHIIEDSSGNAGASIAAYAASAGVTCDIYVPEQTSPAKLTQILSHGATLTKVPGSRDDTSEAAFEAAQSHYYASHSWNPFFFQGTKTFAYEICEQLDWTAPDTVILPVGNGTLLIGAALGFDDLFNTGIISKIPKLIAIQSSSCAPLYHKFTDSPKNDSTSSSDGKLAEGIAVGTPVRGDQIIRMVRKSGGDVIAVDDHEITEALRDLVARGLFVEPTAAAAIAGVMRYLSEKGNDESVVSVLTGHGLKAPEKIRKIVV